MQIKFLDYQENIFRRPLKITGPGSMSLITMGV